MKDCYSDLIKQPSMHQNDRKPPIDGSVIPPQLLCKSLTRQARVIPLRDAGGAEAACPFIVGLL